jgi:GAF domain-containing protein
MLLMVLLAVGNQIRYPFSLTLAFVVIAIVLAWKNYAVKSRRGRVLTRAKMEHVLAHLVNAVERYQCRQGEDSLRANIMILGNERLQIVASCRMANNLDQDITFAVGQGCCGEAYDSGQLVVGDLSSVYMDTWEETRREYGSPPWGITRQQFEKTRTLKSVLSVPMVQGDRVLGVLNLDDKVPLDEAGFGDDEMLLVIGGYMCFAMSIISGEAGG